MNDKTRSDLHDPFLPDRENEPETETKTGEKTIDRSVFKDAAQLAKLVRGRLMDWEEELPEYRFWSWDLLIEDDPDWYFVPDYKRSGSVQLAGTDDGADSLA